MTMNIKDPEAHHLAQAIARVTGDSLTKVVVDSLRERHRQLEQHKGKAGAQEILDIAERARSQPLGPVVEHGALLYDELGLPR